MVNLKHSTVIHVPKKGPKGILKYEKMDFEVQYYDLGDFYKTNLIF